MNRRDAIHWTLTAVKPRLLLLVWAGLKVKSRSETLALELSQSVSSCARALSVSCTAQAVRSDLQKERESLVWTGLLHQTTVWNQ